MHSFSIAHRISANIFSNTFQTIIRNKMPSKCYVLRFYVVFVQYHLTFDHEILQKNKNEIDHQKFQTFLINDDGKYLKYYLNAVDNERTYILFSTNKCI